jgi:hypothetical protein
VYGDFSPTLYITQFSLFQLIEVFFLRILVFVSDVMSNTRTYIYGLCSNARLEIRNQQTPK